MKTRDEYLCPLELTHDITKGKWKPIIIWLLGKHSASLSYLKRKINGISQKVLLEQLKELMEYDLVEKKSSEGYPLRVEYSLKSRGLKMNEAILIMQEIGIDIMLENGQEDILRQKRLID